MANVVWWHSAAEAPAFHHHQGFSARRRRDMLRKTWVPTGKALTALQERGIVIRFIVGRSCVPLPGIRALVCTAHNV